MRYIEQERLKNKSKLFNNLLYIINGTKELRRQPWKNFVVVVFFSASHLIWQKRLQLYEIASTTFFYPIFKLIMDIAILTILALSFILMMLELGKPLISKRVHDNFLRIGFCNRAGETPILLSKYKHKNKPHITTMEFLNNGIPQIEFENQKNELETVLNVSIIKVTNGKNMKRTILQTASAKNMINKIIPWKESNLSYKDFVLKLGENNFEVVELNLSDIPHILLGGSSGSGKSVLLKLLLHQCIRKGAITYIADFKGGVDFNQWWHSNSTIILKVDHLLDTLNTIVSELENRKELFRGVGSANIVDYNAQGHSLKRIIFATDEIAEVLDKTGLEKEQKSIVQEIEKNISIIARQGRAFGIHMVIATQRPDANILTGQIKSNINYRVCGRADSILSSIILDNTDARRTIPSDSKGLFMNHEGTVFQAYYYED